MNKSPDREGNKIKGKVFSDLETPLLNPCKQSLPAGVKRIW